MYGYQHEPEGAYYLLSIIDDVYHILTSQVSEEDICSWEPYNLKNDPLRSAVVAKSAESAEAALRKIGFVFGWVLSDQSFEEADEELARKLAGDLDRNMQELASLVSAEE